MRAPALRGLLWLAACAALGACNSGNSPVVISEFLAANGGGLTDLDGDTSDWIELHNRGKTAVDLEGWCLTDSTREPRRWCFPAISIPAEQYLLVFASGKNLSEQLAGATTQLHTTFRLKASEDYLALLHPNGSIAHEFAPYPEQRQDVSFGLTAAGAEGYLKRPTPGAPNSEAREPEAVPAKPAARDE